jgi:hypothetical protein
MSWIGLTIGMCMKEVNDMKKKKAAISCILLCLCFWFSGCGLAKVPEKVLATSLAVSEKGVITYYYVDAFDKEYYNVSELTTMAMDEVAAFNAGFSDKQESNPVVLQNVETIPDEGGRVVLHYQCDSADTFENFQKAVLFYGTVEEAAGSGYSFSEGVTDVKSGQLISEGEILKNNGQRVIVTDVQAFIYPPAKVVGVMNAVLREDGTVDSTGSLGNVIILMK